MTTIPPTTDTNPPTVPARSSLNSHLLVVCGGNDVEEDSWLFADFIGITKAFESLGTMKSTLLNCFPYAEWFKLNKRDIKFGYKSWTDDAPISIFSSHDQPYWCQIHDSQSAVMAQTVLQSISSTAEKLGAGDTFTIFLITHGHSEGHLKIGTSMLLQSDLQDAIGRVPYGVHLNLFLKACYSGKILHQMRGNGWGRLYVHSSAQARNKSWSLEPRAFSPDRRGSWFTSSFAASMEYWRPDGTTPPRTIREHIDHVRRAEFFWSKPGSKPVHYTTWPLSRPVVDIICANYVQICHTAGDPNAPELLSPKTPKSSPLPFSSLPTTPSEAVSATMRVMDSEWAYDSWWGPPHHEDMGFNSRYWYLQHGNPDQKLTSAKTLVDSIRWRYQFEQRLMILVLDLGYAGLISTQSLLDPIDWEVATEDGAVRALSYALATFEYAALAYDHSYEENEEFSVSRGKFTAPLDWLAVLLLRSSTTVIQILYAFEHIAHGNWLGPSREPVLAAWHQFLGEWQEGLPPGNLKWNESLAVGDEISDDRDERICFWLPHGITEGVRQRWARRSYDRYLNARSVYEMVFGEGTWGSDEGILEIFEAFWSIDMEGYRPSSIESATPKIASQS